MPSEKTLRAGGPNPATALVHQPEASARQSRAAILAHASGWYPEICPLALRIACAAAALLAFSVFAAPSRADRPSLPEEEQKQVNQAIDAGTKYLLVMQGPRGTWPTPNGKHVVGYAALPGLTLLECGVPADDPAVQRSARFVRSAVPRLDTTYELSLSVLFLDRLGDPKDEKLIQTMALRLVAGQAPSGGWGYKCPILTGPQQADLLTALKNLGPPPDLVALRPDRLDRPALGNQPGMPGLAIPADKERPPPGLVLAKSPGEMLTGSPAEKSQALGRVSVPRPGWCIKAAETPPAPGDKPPGDANSKPPARPEPRKPVVIPPELAGLTVFHDLPQGPVQDPRERGQEPLLPTTDNSNTQFAVLALWTAQRHDLPMERTLRHVAHRFQSSQCPKGGWGYRYSHGGNVEQTGAMTGSGLLGLAVGHGLARDGQPALKNVQDPMIARGFIALYPYVGEPSGRTERLPMVNLYLLWSVERVAVLYDLPTIGDKDWYRWGAEILVANQVPKRGSWQNGQYPESNGVLDTCFALLFLKRANLAKDLTDKLPIDPKQLVQTITDGTRTTEKEPEPKKVEEAKKDPPVELARLPKAPDTRPNPVTTEPEGGSAADEGSARRKWVGLVYLLGFLLLLLVGAFVFLVSREIGKRQAEADRQRGATKKSGKRRGPRSSAPNAGRGPVMGLPDSPRAPPREPG
jgi:hypothetical protein